MPQPPILVDSIQIENPNTTITRTLDGQMSFKDTLTPTGLVLSNMASLKEIQGLFLVGVGKGATHATIQSAINDVPLGSPNKYLILVFAGIYMESLLVDKNNIYLQGLGDVVVSSGSPNTLRLQHGASEVPQLFSIENIKIQNTAASGNCIFVEGGANTQIGSEGLYFKNLVLVPSGLGSRCWRIEVANNVYIENTQILPIGSSSGILSQVSNCRIEGCRQIPNLSVSFDTSLTLPQNAAEKIEFKNCEGFNITTSLTNAQELSISDSTFQNLSFFGDRKALIENSTLEDFSINAGFSVVTRNTKRGTVAGLGTLAETEVKGEVSFVAENTKFYSFEIEQPDANYFVFVENTLNEVPQITNKTVLGFDITYLANQTTTLPFFIRRF